MAKNGKTAFFAVEGTLIDGSSKLIQSTVTRIKDLKKQGYTIVLWATKGGRYAESVAELNNIRNLVDIYIGKPSIVVDSDEFPLRTAQLETPKYLRREF